MIVLAVIAALMLSTGAGAQERSGFYTRDVVLKVNTLTLPLLVANAGI